MSSDSCNHQFLTAHRFCGICGKSLPSRMCDCGHVNSIESSYCSYCGIVLDGSEDANKKDALSSIGLEKVRYSLSMIVKEAEIDKRAIPVNKDEIISQDNIKDLFKKKKKPKE